MSDKDKGATMKSLDEILFEQLREALREYEKQKNARPGIWDRLPKWKKATDE